MKKREITYILHHFEEENEPFGAVSPPIFQTSNFSFPTFGEFQNAINNEDEEFLYTRGNNPTIRLVEEKIAKLENGEDARLFASGVSAIAGAVMAFVDRSSHIVAVKDAYGWAKTLFEEYLFRFGVEVTYVSGEDPEEIEDAIRPNTKIIYLESPTSYTFRIQDLREVADIAKRHHVKTMIDNSWATPYFQNPIDYGIDIVIHSTSKYLGGHTDVMGGVVVGKRDDIKQIFERELLNIGGVADPFGAWLLLRGLRTLHIRMERHFSSVMKVISYLAQHPKVEEILYPLWEGDPQYRLAKRQMRGGASLFSIKLKTKERGIERFTDKLKYFKKAVSWGGYCSLVVPYLALHPDAPSELASLVRIYIGLEDPEFLINDLEDALGVI